MHLLSDTSVKNFRCSSDKTPTQISAPSLSFFLCQVHVRLSKRSAASDRQQVKSAQIPETSGKEGWKGMKERKEWSAHRAERTVYKRWKRAGGERQKSRLELECETSFVQREYRDLKWNDIAWEQLKLQSSSCSEFTLSPCRAQFNQERNPLLIAYLTCIPCNQSGSSYSCKVIVQAQHNTI